MTKTHLPKAVLPEASLIVINASQLATSVGASRKPLIKNNLKELQVIENGAVAVKDDLIIAVGTTEEVLAQVKVSAATEVIDATGQVVLPGLVDPHTHLVFGGSREHEMELKLAGMSYLEILSQGGGILSTVRATQQASLAELVAVGQKYADQMLSQGTTTAEAKSGYGLTTADELKTLEAIKKVNENHPLELVPTFLGAHAIPADYKENPEVFVELVINEMIPRVAEENLAVFCDVFCEQGVFSIDQSRRILTAARAHGMELKLHADEIVPLGGAELAAELKAQSADHLLVVTDAGIAELAAKEVVGVLLPGTTFYLREDHYAPARKMIEKGVPVALASDFNPGSCPNNSLQIIMTMAFLYLKMTAAEIVNAVTINAAHAIGVAHKVGSLEIGKQGDVVLFDAPNYQYLPYRFGSNLVKRVIKKGRVVV